MRTWMFVRLVVFLLLVGCYRPEPPAGARCAGDRCPSGLTCRDGICVDDDTPLVDARIVIDARLVDASTPDALDLVGCADGAREGFTTIAMFPNVAGCAASWNAAVSMRATATAQPCGDDIQLCATPADACSPGWHICGANGQPAELTTRMTEAECASAGDATIANARFAAALSHCSSYDGAICGYDVPRGCALDGACAEPVCCGAGCRNDAGCTSGAFAMQGIAGSLTNGCASMLAAEVTGVLCCR